MLKFPNGKHDDVIDALASAVALLKTNSNNVGISFEIDYSDFI